MWSEFPAFEILQKGYSVVEACVPGAACAADADCAAPSHDECIDSHDFISATDIPASVLERGDSVLEGSTDGDPITAIV